jgi:hypothetical protein
MTVKTPIVLIAFFFFRNYYIMMNGINMDCIPYLVTKNKVVVKKKKKKMDNG